MRINPAEVEIWRTVGRFDKIAAIFPVSSVVCGTFCFLLPRGVSSVHVFLSSPMQNTYFLLACGQSVFSFVWAKGGCQEISTEEGKYIPHHRLLFSSNGGNKAPLHCPLTLIKHTPGVELSQNEESRRDSSIKRAKSFSQLDFLLLSAQLLVLLLSSSQLELSRNWSFWRNWWSVAVCCCRAKASRTY